MRNYEDLKVWERSHKLCLEIYGLTNNFPSEEKFGLISQLRRASSSVPTNIAEGCGYDTPKEFAYLLRLSKDLDFITQENFEVINEEARIIRRMLYNLRMSQLK